MDTSIDLPRNMCCLHPEGMLQDTYRYICYDTGKLKGSMMCSYSHCLGKKHKDQCITRTPRPQLNRI